MRGQEGEGAGGGRRIESKLESAAPVQMFQLAPPHHVDGHLDGQLAGADEGDDDGGGGGGRLHEHGGQHADHERGDRVVGHVEHARGVAPAQQLEAWI